MGKMKLIYFDIRGRGEPIRMILAYNKVDYEDFRIDFSEWKEAKQNYPTGQLPVLELEDGTKMPQSMAIIRYLAKKYNMVGSNPMSEFNADVAVETILDTVNEAVRAKFEKDETRKVELFDQLKSQSIPKLFEVMKLFQSSNGGSYLVGNKLTYADIVLFTSVEFLKDVAGEITVPSEIQNIVDKVKSNPNITDWLNKRPKNSF